MHPIAYRSTDTQATTEAFHTVTVKIDTQRPVTKAPRSASVRRYGYVTLRYRVNDLPIGARTATVTIRVKTLGGATKKVLRLGSRPTNTDAQTVSFRCLLPRRTYRFYVYATDPAGNVQAIAGTQQADGEVRRRGGRGRRARPAASPRPTSPARRLTGPPARRLVPPPACVVRLR